MKNIAIIFTTIFMISTAAFAGDGNIDKKSSKKQLNQKTQLTEKFSNMLGYPSYILDGTNQSAMISFTVDEMDVIHVNEVSSANDELKKYIIKHIDGKKMKNMDLEGKNGIVKVLFTATKSEKLNFQY